MAAHRNPVKRQQKRFPTRPFFFNGSLELLLLPAKACVYFITGTAGSIPFSIASEDAASMVLFFSFPPQSTRNNLPLHHKGSFSDKASFLSWSTFLPPSTSLCFAYPMYHSADYFSFADMGKLTGFPLISVDFIVFSQSHLSRRSWSG